MDIDKLLNDLKGTEPHEVGTLLMYYITKNFSKEDRMKAIYDVIRTFGIDFLTHELEKEDLKTVRDLAVIIKKRL